MIVWNGPFEYSLYTTADGAWVMHTFVYVDGQDSEWLSSSYDVSRVNPFTPGSKSVVKYDAWR